MSASNQELEISDPAKEIVPSSEKDEDTHEEKSIYHLYPTWKKAAILVIAVFVALLTPFTDTIYLPALKSVGSSLNASDTSVAITVSAYLIAVGVGQIFWGPISDYYGRLYLLYFGLLFYEAFTIACIFADSIDTLIALRTLEGFVIGSTFVSVQAIIADVFPKEELGLAVAAFLTPMLIGPIIAPIVGGLLSNAFGWRSTFTFLSIMNAPIIVLTWFALPETHHWYVIQKVHSSNSYTELSSDKRKVSAKATQFDVVSTQDEAVVAVDLEAPSKKGSDEGTVAVSGVSPKKIRLIEAEHTTPPVYTNPWATLAFIFDIQLAPHYFLMATVFSVMFTSATMLPLRLAVHPFNLSESIIGVCYLPIGVAMLLGSIVAGGLSDKAAVDYPVNPEGRMRYAVMQMWLTPLAAIGFGFTFAYSDSLPAVLICHAILGYGFSSMMPTTMSFLAAARPKSQATATSVMMGTSFALSGVCVSISVILSDVIGIEYFFLLISCITLVGSVWSTIVVLNKSGERVYKQVSSEKVETSEVKEEGLVEMVTGDV